MNLKQQAILKEAIDLYMREDYDYVVSLALRDEKPQGIDTVEEEVNFLIRNHLDRGLSSEELTCIAKEILRQIKQINERVAQNVH